MSVAAACQTPSDVVMLRVARVAGGIAAARADAAVLPTVFPPTTKSLDSMRLHACSHARSVGVALAAAQPIEQDGS